MKTMNAVIEDNGVIRLPSSLMSKMRLQVGDHIKLSYNPTRASDMCFVIETDNEKELFEESFYCVPMRLFNDVGLKMEDLQIILSNEEITITSSQNIIRDLPLEFILAMDEQKVDFVKIADSVVERLNEHELESEQ